MNKFEAVEYGTWMWSFIFFPITYANFRYTLFKVFTLALSVKMFLQISLCFLYLSLVFLYSLSWGKIFQKVLELVIQMNAFSLKLTNTVNKWLSFSLSLPDCVCFTLLPGERKYYFHADMKWLKHPEVFFN